MSFYESPRFPETISYGAVGGPKFNTSIVIVDSGTESRNAVWSAPLHQYDVAHGLKTQAQLDELKAFFMNAKGKANGFRFKDWQDFSATVSTGVFTTVSTNVFQMGKVYTSGSQSFTRTIKKPISGSLTISGGGTYTVDYTTGLVTRTAGSAPTVWAGQFDVPVRFDSDQMMPTINDYNNFSWGQIPILELRNP